MYITSGGINKNVVNILLSPAESVIPPALAGHGWVASCSSKHELIRWARIGDEMTTAVVFGMD